MRLAAINTTASPFHAPASLMLDVARGFVAASADNKALLLYGRGGHELIPGISFKRVGNDASVINHYLWSRILDQEGLMSRRATAQIVESLKIFQPDIIHLHNLHGHYLHYPSLFNYLAKLDIPVVITLHDLWSMTGRCCFPEDCDKWMNDCRYCPNRRLYPATMLSNSRINRLLKADCINQLPNVTLVAPSQWAARHVSRSSLRLCPSIVIPNGVSDDVFVRLEPNNHKSKGMTTILAVANKWEARKRPEIIYGIAKLLNDNERLIVVGDVGKRHTNLPNTTFIPQITDFATLVKTYNSADYTISASSNETYGMTVAESMSCGTPVIVPADSAMAEYVTTDDGIIVPSVTPEEYINAIRNNRSCFNPKAPSSRKDAMQRYIDLFSSLINEID